MLRVARDGALEDRVFAEMPGLCGARDLLVLNDSAVIRARLAARKPGGGRVEALIERILSPRRALARLGANRPARVGMTLALEPPPGADDARRAPGAAANAVADAAATNAAATNAAASAAPAADAMLEVTGRVGEFFELRWRGAGDFDAVLRHWGAPPLPPYMRRAATPADARRYQTVYARAPGSVAAPTAGLHIDAATLAALRRRRTRVAAVTLHVGSGTYQPLRDGDLAAHRMHSEWMRVDAETCAAVARCRRRGGRVIAVGTTTLRALETAAARAAANCSPMGGPACTLADGAARSSAGGRAGLLADGQAGSLAALSTGMPAGADELLQPFEGETDLFVRPGYRFRVVDVLITNFHFPASSLFVLVCAFAGRARMLRAYRHAVRRGYRFFSYGDATWLERARVRA